MLNQTDYPPVDSLLGAPADTMVPYEAVAHLLFGTTQKAFKDASRNGTVPRVVRLTHKSAMHFRAQDLAGFIDERIATFDTSAEVTK